MLWGHLGNINNLMPNDRWYICCTLTIKVIYNNYCLGICFSALRKANNLSNDEAAFKLQNYLQMYLHISHNYPLLCQYKKVVSAFFSFCRRSHFSISLLLFYCFEHLTSLIKILPTWTVEIILELRTVFIRILQIIQKLNFAPNADTIFLHSHDDLYWKSKIHTIEKAFVAKVMSNYQYNDGNVFR